MKQKNHSRLVVVTGSRKTLSTDEKKLIKTKLILEAFDFDGPVMLMHGAATGVDEFSGQVAQAHHHSVLPMPAQWDEHHKPAGIIRNRCMANVIENMSDCGWQVVVYAFPRMSSRGTRDMIARVREQPLQLKVHSVHIHELSSRKNTSPEQSDNAQVPLFVGSTHLVGNPDHMGPPLVRVPAGCDRLGCLRDDHDDQTCSCACHVF